MKTQYYNRSNKTINIIKETNLFSNIRDRINTENNGSTVIVPHVCNNIGVFNGGFAGQVANLFPEVKVNYMMLGGNLKLGMCQFVITNTSGKNKHKIIFANMIAQNKLLSHNNTRPLNYGALVYCMNDVRSYIKKCLSDASYEFENIEIHAPKFGSGLAGGDWNFIQELIHDLWFDLQVFIYAQNKGNKQ